MQTDSQVFAFLKNRVMKIFPVYISPSKLLNITESNPFFQPKNLCTAPSPSPTSSPCETEWPLAHHCADPKKPICFVEANSSWMVWNISWKPTMATWVGNGCTDAGNTNSCGEERTGLCIKATKIGIFTASSRNSIQSTLVLTNDSMCIMVLWWWHFVNCISLVKCLPNFGSL